MKPRQVRGLVGLLLVAALGACSTQAPRKLTAQTVPVPQPFASAMAARRAEDAAKAPAASHRVGTVARRAIGPFVASTDASGLVAWIEAGERGGQELMVVPLGADGAPLRAAKSVADVPNEATSLFVRASGGPHGGWLAGWTALLDRGEALTVVGFAPDGTARGKPADVQRTSDHLQWADLVTTSKGALCLWAEQTAAGDANLLVSSVDPDGKPTAMPARIARGVVGWAATGTTDGAGLALVTTAPQAGDGKAGLLSWMRLDQGGAPMGPPRPIGSMPSVSGDVELAARRGGSRGPWVLGWTDRTGEEAQVMLATVDEAGRVQGPSRAMNAVGGSVLVALASGASGEAIAWEEPRVRARARRSLHLAALAEDGLTASPLSSIRTGPSGAIELAGTASGFALVGATPQCTTSAEGCNGSPSPTFVRFDAHLMPMQAEPLFVGDVPDVRVAATLGWGLRCAGDRCSVLAATSEAPTPVYSVDLPARVAPFVAPMVRPAPPDAPFVTGVATVASGLPFQDVAAANVGDTTLIASLASQRGQADAVVSVRALGADGQPLPSKTADTTVTSRAVSVGGLAMAAGANPGDGAALAWVRRDGSGAHVHLARFDRTGRRVGEAQLTTGRGDATSVSLAWAGDGWIVGWVDARDGNGEVYAAKVDRELRRVGREERVTRAPGDAADVSLAARGDVVWVAWSDPRESPHEGLADVYVTRLRARDAARVGDEVRVLATAAHSRSPQIAAVSGGAIVVWIEASPGEIDAPGSAMMARVGDTGRVVGAPVRVDLGGEGRPTAIALGSSDDGVRAVVARTLGDAVTLDGVVVPADDSRPPRAWPLLDIDAPAAFDVALALVGGATGGLFYDDTATAPGSHRVRRATIAWRR
jgi:hypothetical protein